MSTNENRQRWSPPEAFHRLNLIADRLGAEIVVHALGSADPAPMTLRESVAYFYVGLLEASRRSDQAVLAYGIVDEITPEVWAQATELCGEEEVDVDGCDFDSITHRIAIRWGHPVAGLLEQQHERPTLFSELMDELPSAEEGSMQSREG